jgi:choline dehydrogenase-like flavoprotein
MRETGSGQSLIEDEVVPNGYTAMLPSPADEAFNKRIRDFRLSLNHPCGNCSMSKVIDSNRKVMGAQRLRVIDASFFPIPIAAHPQVYVYTVAEKATEMAAQSTVEVRA